MSCSWSLYRYDDEYVVAVDADGKLTWLHVVDRPEMLAALPEWHGVPMPVAA